MVHVEFNRRGRLRPGARSYRGIKKNISPRPAGRKTLTLWKRKCCTFRDQIKSDDQTNKLMLHISPFDDVTEMTGKDKRGQMTSQRGKMTSQKGQVRIRERGESVESRSQQYNSNTSTTPPHHHEPHLRRAHKREGVCATCAEGVSRAACGTGRRFSLACLGRPAQRPNPICGRI